MDAISVVKDAESEAKKILQKAKEDALQERKSAEERLEARYQAKNKEYTDQANEEINQAKAEAEKDAEHILAQGREESEKITNISDEKLNIAVKKVVERIVNRNGNS